MLQITAKRNWGARLLRSCWILTLLMFLRLHSQAANEARLTLSFVNPETQQRVPGWFRILDGKERPIEMPDCYHRGIGLRASHPARQWCFVHEPEVLSLPKGEVFIEGFVGVNSEPIRRKLDLRFFNRLTVKLPVKRLRHMRAAGWYAGNTHLHLRSLAREAADHYLRTVPAGDDLDLVFVSYLARPSEDASYISNQYSRTSLTQMAVPGLLYDNGEEHRHNFSAYQEGYGHVMFLQLPRLVEPVSIGRGINGEGWDFPPLQRGIQTAQDLGATVIWCHNQFGLEDTPNWLAGRVDAQNIFDGGSRGDYSDPYYQYLNIGLAVPLSTGTDWFVDDFSRVYVNVDGELSADTWLAGLRRGRSFITNGPLLDFEVEGEGPGARIDRSAPGEVSVRASVRSRLPFGSLELVLNGEVIQSRSQRRVGKLYEAVLEWDVLVDEPSWLAARVGSGALDTNGNVVVPSAAPIRGSGEETNEMGEAVFAHTSPIYLDLNGNRRFDSEVAGELIARMELAREQIKEAGRFQSDENRDGVLQLYQEQIDRLQARVRSQPLAEPVETNQNHGQGDKAP